MHIICPHCTTSYAISSAALGVAGRTVRCSRCKEVWLAQPADAVHAEMSVPSLAPSETAAAVQPAAGWGPLPSGSEASDQAVPMVESPSISGEMPEADEPSVAAAQLGAMHRADAVMVPKPRRGSWLRRSRRRDHPATPASRRARKPLISLSTACAAMGALALALTIWRADVVRLLPQTAAFYKLAGIEVNLRGLVFKDLKISTETVDGKPVLVIEGAIIDVARKPVELPRLRFIVRDVHGTEIYAWNAVLEQPILKPGEKAWFRSRLASPPAEAHDVDVRFFNRRDIAGGA